MNRMEINGPGAEFKIKMKKLLSEDTMVNRVEASQGYNNAAYFGNQMAHNQQKTGYQSLRWIDRYLLNLTGIKENDIITLRGSLEDFSKTEHRLGQLPIRPTIDKGQLEKQGEFIQAETGMRVTNYIDVTTRIVNYALKIPFDIKNPYVKVELDEQENSYIITIQELAFKRQCNEAIKQYVLWCDKQNRMELLEEFLFLKKFCEIKSDRKKIEEQKQTAQALEAEKRENTKEWESRTADYVQMVDWTQVIIRLGFVMVDLSGASVELQLENLPENSLSRKGILISDKLQFIEQEQGMIIENQLDYLPKQFKTRIICAAVKYINEEYKAKYAQHYEYKRWHTVCERREYFMEFSRKFTYYSEEQLAIVREEGISFAEWGRNAVPGEYEDLFEEE